MYETHCGDYHCDRIHQRERARSRVQSLEELQAQVARWSVQTECGYSAQDLADIAGYLNQSYCRLER